MIYHRSAMDLWKLSQKQCSNNDPKMLQKWFVTLGLDSKFLHFKWHLVHAAPEQCTGTIAVCVEVERKFVALQKLSLKKSSRQKCESMKEACQPKSGTRPLVLFIGSIVTMIWEPFGLNNDHDHSRLATELLWWPASFSSVDCDRRCDYVHQIILIQHQSEALRTASAITSCEQGKNPYVVCTVLVLF